MIQPDTALLAFAREIIRQRAILGAYFVDEELPKIADEFFPRNSPAPYLPLYAAAIAEAKAIAGEEVIQPLTNVHNAHREFLWFMRRLAEGSGESWSNITALHARA